MVPAHKHQIVWSSIAGVGEKIERTVSCTACDFSAYGYDNKIKPAFAQHKRDIKAAQQEVTA